MYHCFAMTRSLERIGQLPRNERSNHDSRASTENRYMATMATRSSTTNVADRTSLRLGQWTLRVSAQAS